MARLTSGLSEGEAALRLITPPNDITASLLSPGQANVSSRFKSSNLKHRTSDIEHPTSNIEHRTSNIEHPTSNIEHPTSNIEHPTSNIEHPTPNIRHRTSNIQHPTSNIECHRLSQNQSYFGLPDSDRKRTRSRNSARVRVSASPLGITEPFAFFSLMPSRRTRTSWFRSTSRNTTSSPVSRIR